jgi:hypothetical protein
VDYNGLIGNESVNPLKEVVPTFCFSFRPLSSHYSLIGQIETVGYGSHIVMA